MKKIYRFKQKIVLVATLCLLGLSVKLYTMCIGAPSSDAAFDERRNDPTIGHVISAVDAAGYTFEPESTFAKGEFVIVKKETPVLDEHGKQVMIQTLIYPPQPAQPMYETTYIKGLVRDYYPDSNSYEIQVYPVGSPIDTFDVKQPEEIGKLYL